MSIPIAPPPAQAASSSQATTALILGIVGVVCCGPAAPVAWYLGNKELEQIAAGLSPASGEGAAKAGKILGMVGSALLILWLVWIVFFGGMAILSGLSHAGR